MSRFLVRPAGTVLEVAQRLDPVRFFQPDDSGPSTVALVCVYRRANARWVRRLLEQLPVDAVVRLWALDEVATELRDATVGCGPGGRLDLLNRLVAAIDSPCEVMVIADDDVGFVVGDLPRLLRIGRWLGLDLFQPAHGRRSSLAYRFTRKRWLTVGRRTRFVEQGPLVVLSATAQRRILPFPDHFGMGWGIEARWSTLEPHLAMGIVDAVAVRHVRRGTYGYDTVAEQGRLDAELLRLGIPDIHDLHRDLHRLRLVDALADARPRKRA